MKKFLLLLIAFVLLVPSLEARHPVKELFVLHTSDTHSRIEPVPDASSAPDAGKGGVVRRASFVAQFRAEHPDALLFDCGDISQGTPYYNLFQGELEVRMMNRMKYDAMTIGNHEFDFGLENMARLFRLADFPVVCANYDVRDTPLEGLVKPYIVLRRGGVRIGVFGLSPRMEGLVQADKCRGVRFIDPVDAARRVVQVLRKEEKCDVVICLSHLGMLGAASPQAGDEILVAHTEGIDLVLGGHTHTNMEQPAFLRNAAGAEVPVMHVGKNGAYVGKIKLELESK